MNPIFYLKNSNNLHSNKFLWKLQLVGLASSAFGLYYILDNERIQMHQVILVNLQDVKDMAKSEAQPVLYYLSLALIGSGFLMALIGLFKLFSASREHLGLISLVSM